MGRQLKTGEWLDEITRIHSLRDECNTNLIRAISGARKAGWPWQAIGEAMGMTRQGAMQHYRFVDGK